LYSLDKFHKGISNSFKSGYDLSVPTVKRNEWLGLTHLTGRAGVELVMACLFFDAPKNNTGFIHYKPLKMCKTAVWFLGIFE